MKIAFYTLGCKVNQYETQALEQMFSARGHVLVPFEEQADAYIINTCTVTAVSDKKSRNVIRRVRKDNPDAVIAVCGCYPQHAAEKLREMGIGVVEHWDSDSMTVTGRPSFRSARIETQAYPGFPTDAQAPLMAALLRSRGVTVFEENLFTSRYRHVDELIRMGADIRVFGRTAVVTGTEALQGALVRCTDLRGGAALCVAALAAEGETRITEIGHIDRGYEQIARDLRALGAEIVRTETDKE